MKSGSKPRNCGSKRQNISARLKATKELRDEIGKLKLSCGRHMTESIFGDTTFYFVGMGAYTCAGYECVGERQVFSFHDQGHVDNLLGQPKASWPKGLRKVKNSTVERWREQEES